MELNFKSNILKNFLVLFSILFMWLAMNHGDDTSTGFLIDDFSKTNGTSFIGTRWRMFTDRVMGGLSTGASNYDTIAGRRCLRLQGSVTLENNGGFIQIALPLQVQEDYFNARGYRGVRLWVYGNGEKYFLHLRTNQTQRPWQYFGAVFLANRKWAKIEIPFNKFKPENLNGELNQEKLARIAIVAIKKKFEADIAVSRLEFYK